MLRRRQLSLLKLLARRYTSGTEFKPYVGKPYSYTFGRSSDYMDYKTMSEAFLETVDKVPNKVGIIMEHQNKAITFKEYNDDVNKLSKALLQDFGLKKGDVVGIWLMNCYEWFVVQQAALRIGAIFCPLSPFCKHTELAFALQKAQMKALFIPSPNSPQNVFNDFVGTVEKTPMAEISKQLKHLIFVEGEVAQTSLKNHFSLHQFDNLLSGDGQLNALPNVDPEDPGAILFTSGTTGQPKATLISHFHMYNDVKFFQKRRNPQRIDDVIMAIPLPLFHAYAAVGSASMCIFGDQGVFSGYWFNPTAFYSAMIKHNCTELWGVPAMLLGLSEYAQTQKEKPNSIRVLQSGAAMLTKGAVAKILQGFPSVSNVLVGYGATECGPGLTSTTQDDPLEKRIETVGRVLDHIELKLVDVNTKETVKIGEEGEVWARGFCRMICYLNDEAKTKEVIDAKGWYNLGDIGKMDNEGYLKIVGRTKEMIIRGGINIFPKEIEGLLFQYPDILEAYVCGVPDENLGEEICALVKMKTTGFDPKEKAEEIKEYCKANISAYKVPRYILFVDSFPMTGSGKPQKFAMTQLSCKMLNIATGTDKLLF